MRSILTMFGIIVGISSVLLINSLGLGFKNALQQQFSDIGVDNLTVVSKDNNEPLKSWEKLHKKDVENLKQYKKLRVVTDSKFTVFNESVESYDKKELLNPEFYGVEPEYKELKNLKISAGRFINEMDVINQSNVAVINAEASIKLLGTQDSIGMTLPIRTYDGTYFLEIVGVLEAQANSAIAAAFGRAISIYTPYTYAKNIVPSGQDPDEISSIEIKVFETKNMEEIKQNIIKILELTNQNKDVYEVMDSGSFVNNAYMIISIFTIFLSAIAAISLLVGGIGLMNIMLVSVTERTREIGIRKSLGATNYNIRLQFMIESIILTFIGGFIGLVIGYTLSQLLSPIISSILNMEIIPITDMNVVIISIVICVITGVVFGVLPANKAAKLDPVESLRAE